MHSPSLAPLVLALAAAPVALAAPAAPGAVIGDATPPTHAGHVGHAHDGDHAGYASPTAGPSTAEDPQPLPLDGSVNLRLPAEGPATYRFEAPGPGVLKVAAGGTADLVIGVLGPEGLEAAAGHSDQDLDGDWSESVEVPLVAAGVYLVLVQAYDADADGDAFHLAAAFTPGEPEPSDTLFEEDIALMRALAAPGTLTAAADASGTVPSAGAAVLRVDAAPGLYAVLSASDSDLELQGATVPEDAEPDALMLPSLGGYSDFWSDADYGGEPGREAMVVEVPEGGTAWVSVGGFDGGEAPFRLRLQPLTPPDAAD